MSSAHLVDHMQEPSSVAQHQESAHAAILHGETIHLVIGRHTLPSLLLVPRGSSLSTQLHRRVLTDFLFGPNQARESHNGLLNRDLPPLIVESDDLEKVIRGKKKQEFGAYLWKKLLQGVAAEMETIAFVMMKKDDWIFAEMLKAMNHLQHSLYFLEKRLYSDARQLILR